MQSETRVLRFRILLFGASLFFGSTGHAAGADRPDPDACAPANATYGAAHSAAPTDLHAPEQSSGYVWKRAVASRRYMASTNHPQSTRIACDILAKGGTAVEAAIAAQMALTLVEPQSSGLGGGGFMLYYDARSRRVTSYDGREKAPAAATRDYLRYVAGDPAQRVFPNARSSGRSVGVPGVLRMLALAYQQGLRSSLEWKELFEPTIALARDGFFISSRLAASIASYAPQLAHDSQPGGSASYFLNGDGSPKKAGALLRNPALAETLNEIASGGPGEGVRAFYEGAIAEAIVAKVRAIPGGYTTSLMTVTDVKNYDARERIPVCTIYRAYWVCGMGPPSSGGIAVAQILGLIENASMRLYGPLNRDLYGGTPGTWGVHFLAEASRLAYADRDKYVADTDFVALPAGGPRGASFGAMVDQAYLRSRWRLVSPSGSMGVAAAGNPGGTNLVRGVDHESGGQGTSQISIVDRYGNAVSMTTTVESAFGSYMMVRGFLLNNQLTDFSANPVDAQNVPLANRVEGNKRPRSSMAPTLVFHRNPDDSRGELFIVTGSPGGDSIIQYVTKILVGVLDWDLDIQQAVSLVNFGASNSPTTNIEGGHPSVTNDLVEGVRALGHIVSRAGQNSGGASIARVKVSGETVLMGGADPRREGTAAGDGLSP